MAQIVTITNPLTGQPTQVDQLEHTAQQIDDAIARALPGGAIDITLQNKAPNGYGLGPASQYLDSWNNANANGFYYSRTDAPTGHWWFGSCEISSNSTVRYLKIECPENNFGYTLECRRSYLGGAWEPWEWVNPPMELGKEYRTTERHLGRPVYVKVIEAGFNPAGMAKTTSDTTVSTSGLVRFSAVSGGWQFPSLMFGGNYDDNGNIQVVVQTDSTGIYVTTLSKTRDMTSVKVNVSVYYTKD